MQIDIVLPILSIWMPFVFFYFFVWKYWLEFLAQCCMAAVKWPILVKKLFATVMLAVGFSEIPFIMLMNFPSIPSFLRIFIMKRCWVLANAFSASIEMIMWIFFPIVLLMLCIALIFFMLNHPCIPGINPVLSWWIIHLICFWI